MKKDPRINANSVTFRLYAVIFALMLFFCGSYAGIYFLLMRSDNAFFIASAMFAYVVVISIAICFLSAYIRRKYIMRPVYRLGEAAQKVAQGDLTVRLAPMRKDGKKDEFEVLFDDFNTMTAELSSIEMLKNDFVSNVSHEIKTPLSVIQNYATILQSEELTETERQEYTQKISDAAGHLSVLVSNILQINRLENQKIKPSLRAFNLSEALCRCILNYDSALDEKEIDLYTELDQNLILTSDENLLDMVWGNLLSNAIKFTSAGGRIQITMKQDGGFVTVTVADSGCGIDEEAAKHIFDKFYQGDTSHATEGNGLGLALSKRIVELLDGEITMDSKMGKGSTFKVRMIIQ